MTTSVQPEDVAQPHLFRRSAQVVVFWVIAAVLAFIGHTVVAQRSRNLGEAFAMLSVFIVAWAYSRTASPDFTVTHAMMVGVTWVVLAVAAEIANGARTGHGWYELMGHPDRPLLRNMMLFVWVFSPAIFARDEEGA